MSEKLIRNLHELTASIRQNSARVEKKMSATAQNGTKPDQAIVASAAKYYKALELLSKE
jgi:hypothetical protein